jgi:hypothetical protein
MLVGIRYPLDGGGCGIFTGAGILTGSEDGFAPS